MHNVEPDGRNGWRVVGPDGILAKGFTNREAWRVADKANAEHQNRQEAMADWAFSQDARRGTG